MTKDELFNSYLTKFKAILTNHQKDPISEYIDIDIDDMDSDKASSLLYTNFYDVIDNDYDFSSSDYDFWHYELKQFLDDHSSEVEDYCDENSLDYNEIMENLESFLDDDIGQSDLAYNFYEPIYQLNGTYNFTASIATLEFSEIFNDFDFSLLDFDKDFFILANITHLDFEEFKKNYFKSKIDEFDELIEQFDDFTLENLYDRLTELSDFFDFTLDEKKYESEKSYAILTKVFSDSLEAEFENRKQDYYSKYEGIHLNKTQIDSASLAKLLLECDRSSLELNFNISGSARDLLAYAKLNDSYSVPTCDSIGLFSGVIYSENQEVDVQLDNFPVSKTSFSLERDYSFNSKNDFISQVVSYEEYDFIKTLHQCTYDNESLPKLVRLCSEVLTKKFYTTARSLNELDVIISKNTDSTIIEQYQEIKIAIENNQEKFSVIEQYGKENINLESLTYLYTPNNATLQDINATILSTKDLLELTQYFVQHSNKEEMYKLAQKTLRYYNSHTKPGLDYLFEQLKDTPYFNQLSYTFIHVHSNKMNEDKKSFINEMILPNFDVNYINEQGNNILFVILNNKDLLNTFIEKGVNISQTNHIGQNVLFSPEIQLETIKFLIDKGINLSQVNNEGKTIFEQKPYLNTYKEELEKVYFEQNMQNSTLKNKKIKI